MDPMPEEIVTLPEIARLLHVVENAARTIVQGGALDGAHAEGAAA